MEVWGTNEVTIKCKCPRCGHEFEASQEVDVMLEVDGEDFAMHNEGWD